MAIAGYRWQMNQVNAPLFRAEATFEPGAALIALLDEQLVTSIRRPDTGDRL